MDREHLAALHLTRRRVKLTEQKAWLDGYAACLEHVAEAHEAGRITDAWAREVRAHVYLHREFTTTDEAGS
jgi:hypothetical protein